MHGHPYSNFTYSGSFMQRAGWNWNVVINNWKDCGSRFREWGSSLQVFQMDAAGAIRDIYVWTPPGFYDHVDGDDNDTDKIGSDAASHMHHNRHRHQRRKYPVLLAIDGQNMFLRPNGENKTTAWFLDEHLCRFAQACKQGNADCQPLQLPVVVGVASHEGTRSRELRTNCALGRKFADFVSYELRTTVCNNLLDIDEHAPWSVIGSSYGGHFALQLLLEYPDRFDQGAGLSFCARRDHCALALLAKHRSVFSGESAVEEKGVKEKAKVKEQEKVKEKVKEKKKKIKAKEEDNENEGKEAEEEEGPITTKKKRFYLDHGNFGIDYSYGTFVEPVHRALLDACGGDKSRLMYKVFEHADHNENDWEARVGVALRFLYG